jgi:CBS domain containing-hemolysin-like protein
MVTLVFIGFFSGYEIAFVSANRLGIELKKKQGDKTGVTLSKFVDNPSKFIGTCLLGLNIFLVAYGLLFTELITQLIWTPLHIHNEVVKLLLDTIISTFIVLVIAEFIPKAIFKSKNDTLLAFFAPVANFFYNILKSSANVFVIIAEWILKYLFNVHVKNKSQAFTHVDLEPFVQQTHEQYNESSTLNKALFENAMSLPTLKVRQCLVPRTEIECLEITDTVETVKNRFIETKLSRMIVVGDNMDDIKGYVHQLDLFKKPKALNDILLPMPVVPESMAVADLINKFARERKSLAWVVDEFGGTAGIVTMEDLLEEIFGEIKDEHDVEELTDRKISDNEFLFSGRVEIDYINEMYNLNIPASDDIETLSGYIIAEHESIPKAKEKILIGKYQFLILNVSDKRIEMVKLTVL